jgi:hypothetical protein
MQQDITEFQPYFVQLVAQLLERRGDPIPDSYLQLLPQLLQQSLWVSKANQVYPACACPCACACSPRVSACALSPRAPAFVYIPRGCRS